MSLMTDQVSSILVVYVGYWIITFVTVFVKSVYLRLFLQNIYLDKKIISYSSYFSVFLILIFIILIAYLDKIIYALSQRRHWIEDKLHCI